jgi:hypothetical protein
MSAIQAQRLRGLLMSTHLILILLVGPHSSAVGQVSGPGRPAFDVVCNNVTANDTVAFQTAITSAEASPNAGPVKLWGTCSIDGTQIIFGDHIAGGQSYLNVELGGASVTVINGALKPSSFTRFHGTRGVGSITSFADWNTSSIQGISNTDAWPVIDIAGVEGVIVDHLTVRGLGTAPTIRLHDVNGGGPVKTQITNSAVMSRYAGGPGASSMTANPVRVDPVGNCFGLQLTDDVFGVGGPLPLPAAVYLQSIGDVFIGSVNGDKTRFSGSGIEINPAVIGMFNLYFENVFSENFVVRATITVDVGGTVANMRIVNTGPSDIITPPNYVLRAMGNISNLRLEQFLSTNNGVLDPQSTGSITYAPADVMDDTMFTTLANTGYPSAGTFQNRYTGRVDDLRRAGVPTAVRFANLVATNVWNWSSISPPDIGCTVTPGLPDPLGGSKAVGMTCSAGNASAPILYSTGVPVVGDIYIAGVTMRATSSAGFRNSSGATFQNSGPVTTVGWNIGGQGLTGINQDWKWQYSVRRVTAANGGQLLLQLSVDDTHPMQYAFPFAVKIPAAYGMSDAEAIAYANSLAPYAPGCLVGTVCGVNGP